MGLIPVVAHANLHQQRHIQFRGVAHVLADFLANLIDQVLAHLQYQFILQVHDELVLEVREEIRQHMSNAAKLDVPLLVEVGVGNNWDEAH